MLGWLLMSNTEQTENFDLSLLDLFRNELESHSQILEKGLVDVESNQTPSSIEPLMRASHSIKGAARVVGLGDIVKLAHAMEDMLNAARSNKLRLDSKRIDCLLRGNDIFLKLSKIAPADIANQITGLSKTIETLEDNIRRLLTGEEAQPIAPPPIAPPPHEKPPTEEVPLIPAPAPTATKEKAYVRVQVDNLNRLMGLAGQLFVFTNNFKDFSEALNKLKQEQRASCSMIEMSTQAGTSAKEHDKELAERELALKQAEKISDDLLNVIDDFGSLLRRLEYLSDRMYHAAIVSRMLPIRDGTHGFHRMIRDLSQQLGKIVHFKINGAETPVDRDILDQLEAPLTHLLRNAVDHGIETPAERKKSGKSEDGHIVLTAKHHAGMLNISITDDGRGIDIDRVRQKAIDHGYVNEAVAKKLSQKEIIEFLFLPGFTTRSDITEISGRGVGLDVVKAMIGKVEGTVQVDSVTGAGTTFTLLLPLTLSVMRTLMVDIDEAKFAFPLARVDRLLQLPYSEIFEKEGRIYSKIDDKSIELISSRQILQIPPTPPKSVYMSIVVINDQTKCYGLIVDKLLETGDLVVIPLDNRLGKVPIISSAAIGEEGQPILIIDVDDLLHTIDYTLNQLNARTKTQAASSTKIPAKHILVVEDSLTVRERERQLLENAGYLVTTAMDGHDGWNLLQIDKFDLVITDIDMPRMNGLILTQKIKRSMLLNKTPVIIVSYQDRLSDQIRGTSCGADRYLTKGDFTENTLLSLVHELLH